MSDGKVEISHRWFGLSDDQVLEELWVRESMRQRLMYSITHPRMPFILFPPKATHAWWDGSCLVTALVKEGPKALAIYKGGRA